MPQQDRQSMQRYIELELQVMQTAFGPSSEGLDLGTLSVRGSDVVGSRFKKRRRSAWGNALAKLKRALRSATLGP